MLLAIALSAVAEDWREELTPPLEPGPVPPPRPLTATYRFGWGAISAADASIDFSRQNSGSELQLKLTARTSGAVRALWRLDAEHIARCVAATLRPISFQQTEKYRHETEKTTAEFTGDEIYRVQETTPPPKVPTKPKRFDFPNLTDLNTALLLVRSQALDEGDRYSLVVYPSRTAYFARIDVLGRETIKVGSRQYDAVKTQISLQHITKEMELEPHSKFKNAYAWLSDDKDRLLLKVVTEVFVGNVWMELQSVKVAPP